MDAKTIGHRLIELRGKRTRDEVCKSTGIKPTALANYENGYRIPRDETKITLCEFYKVGIEELFYHS